MENKPIIINIPPVEEWPLKELKMVCKHNKIKGYTKMERSELIKHVKEIIKKMKPIKNKGDDEFGNE